MYHNKIELSHSNELVPYQPVEIIPALPPATEPATVMPFQPHRTEADEALYNDPQRLEDLRGYFLEMADPLDDYSPGTRRYIAEEGGSLRLALAEVNEYGPPVELDKPVNEAREAYMAVVLDKPWLIGHGAHKQRAEAAEAVYIEAVTNKIKTYVEATTPEGAWDVRQMPSIIAKSIFNDDPIGLQRLSANHLYLLVDTLLIEHTKRREAVKKHHEESRIHRALGSRAVRLTIGGGIFGVALSPRLGIVPESDTYMTSGIELGLKLTSAVIFGLEAPEIVSRGISKFRHRRHTKELYESLADTREMADLALRMTFNSTRHTSAKGLKAVVGEVGSDDHAENIRRFGKVDEQISHMNNDPGRKPYTCIQAFSYAGRILIDRANQVDSIRREGVAGDERQELYLQLGREIIAEDLARMKKGVTESSFHRWLVKGVGVASSAVFSAFAGSIGEAKGLSQDTVHSISSKDDGSDED
jgi:hypothetical protein